MPATAPLLNPYQSPAAIPSRVVRYAAVTSPIRVGNVRQSVLRRQIQLVGGLDLAIHWNGRGIREYVSVDNQRAAVAISTDFQPHFEFSIPTENKVLRCTIDVDVFAFICVREFKLQIDHSVVYHERMF